jgi:SnoaL-like domain
MKRLLLFIILNSGICLLLNGQENSVKNQNKILQDLSDRAALKNIVDTFSILADQKNISKQVELFTENAEVVSKVQGQPGIVLKGRKQIGDAFTAYLNNFETVYHINGQQTTTLMGDSAKGISYCLVVLIGNVQGKKIKTTMGVYYHDDFIKTKGRWFIARRESNFAWQQQEELKNAL